MMDEGRRARLNVDRISSLPDSILTDILSRLQAKEVIQTCIISKRWSKLWPFVPCLDFHYIESESEETRARDLERFENFVSMFLFRRDNATDLHTFSIQHQGRYQKFKSAFVRMWMLYALTHNPKKLHMELWGCVGFQLPDCFFTCESLEDVYMELGALDHKEKIVPDKISLPRLRKLEIKYAYFGDDYLEKFIFGCPVLESLCMNGCDLKMDNISCRTLKKLSVRYCCFISNCSISAPNLESLEFTEPIGAWTKLKDMSKVTKAKVSIHSSKVRSAYYGYEFFSSLSSVENLYVSSICFKILQEELPKCPTFHNLKNLTLGKHCMYCGFEIILSSFLKHCPNLEVLTLLHDDGLCQFLYTQEMVDQNLEQIERFGCKRLKKINVFYSSSNCKLNWLVGLLLKSTLDLQAQIILTKIEF
ncbi:hypothetical protein LUZ60_003808 [Juncus effusus]|nr:hypothetical protein LUZ60_003808 [Juncus effusus]